MATTHRIGLDGHQREFVKLIRANSHRHRLHEVFRDFCELAALSISNAVDRYKRAEREARYLSIVSRYTPEEVNRFPAMLAQVVEALECGFSDCLGQLFMMLELSNHWRGQFFTPYELARLMACITLHDVAAVVAERGYVTVNDPAAGAGGLLIAAAEAMHDQGVPYQRVMHATAQDIDSTAVHMTYIQLSLLSVPAIVIHGNTLAVTEWDHWATPAHVLGMWDRRLHRAAEPDNAAPASTDVRDVAVRQRVGQLDMFGDAGAASPAPTRRHQRPSSPEPTMPQALASIAGNDEAAGLF